MEYLPILFWSMSLMYNIPDGMLSALCYVESKHDVSAVNYGDGVGNSVGLCQVKLSTAKELGFGGTEKDLLDPVINVEYAARYLAFQHKRYKSWNKAVIAYNKGNSRGIKTSQYQRKVMQAWKERR